MRVNDLADKNESLNREVEKLKQTVQFSEKELAT